MEPKLPIPGQYLDTTMIKNNITKNINTCQIFLNKTSSHNHWRNWTIFWGGPKLFGSFQLKIDSTGTFDIII